MTSPLPAAGEQARERIVRLLTDRYADDTLTVEEFEAELDRMHAITDPAELERMAEGLTSGARPAAPRAAAAGATPPSVAAPRVPAGAVPFDATSGLGWQRGALVPARARDEGRMLAIMSSSKRAGPWLVPRYFRAFALMSEAVIDLRDAVLPADGCEIEVGAVMANVKILLPPGVQADVTILAFMGNAHDHTRAEPLGAAAPHVRVTGSSVMAEVQVFGG